MAGKGNGGAETYAADMMLALHEHGSVQKAVLHPRQERLAELQRVRAHGFTAKLCIHPAQVDGVNAVFMPSAAEVAWARRVLDAARTHGGQAVSLDGKMVDLPVIRLAAQTLKQAQAADA